MCVCVVGGSLICESFSFCMATSNCVSVQKAAAGNCFLNVAKEERGGGIFSGNRRWRLIADSLPPLKSQCEKIYVKGILGNESTM